MEAVVQAASSFPCSSKARSQQLHPRRQSPRQSVALLQSHTIARLGGQQLQQRQWRQDELHQGSRSHGGWQFGSRTGNSSISSSSRVSSRSGSRRAAGGGALSSHASIIDWVSIPAWLVKALAERVYPAQPCAPGQYLDPDAHACVYICQPGYSYDPVRRACMRVVPECGDGYVLRGGRCIPVAEAAAYDEIHGSPDANIAGGLSVDSNEPQPLSWIQNSLRHMIRSALFPPPPHHSSPDTATTNSSSSSSSSSGNHGFDCPVGFYYDPVSQACVPICAPGYLYDRRLKRCVPQKRFNAAAAAANHSNPWLEQ